MKNARFGGFIFAILFLSAFTSRFNVHAVESLNVFNIRAYFTSVAVNNGFLYSPTNAGLQIFSITDSATIMFEKNISLSGNRRIFIENEIAFLSGNIFRILDLTDPIDPEELSALEFGIYSSFGTKVHESYAYFASSEGVPGLIRNKLYIIDVSNLRSPMEVASIHDFPNIKGFDMDDNRLLVQWYDPDLPGSEFTNIYDISNPYSPYLVDTLDADVDNYSIDIAVSGHYAFSLINTGNWPYTLIDVVDFSTMEHIDSISVSYGNDIEIEDDKAYIKCDFGFTVLDISDPHNCLVEVSYIDDFQSGTLAIQDTMAYYVRDIHEGNQPYLAKILVISFADADNPQVLSEYFLPDESYSIELIQNYAFIANYRRGIKIFDLSDVQRPILINQIPAIAQVKNLIIDNNRLYFGDFSGSFYLYDISDPAYPVMMNRIDSLGTITDMHIENNIAFLLSEPMIYIIDVDLPSDLDTLTIMTELAAPKFICLKDNILYINVARDSLMIYNVSDPSAPNWESTYQLLREGYELDVNNGIAYVASSRYGMELIDVGDPSNPIYVNHTDHDCRCYDISIFENILFLNAYSYNLIYDIDIPTNPVLLDSIIHDPQQALPTAKIFLQEDLIFVPTTAFVDILRLTPTGIEQVGYIPAAFSLSPNYPNPFNARTTISYSLPVAAPVALDIYDLLGRKVQTLYNGPQPPGEHSLIWNADGFASGVYFYKLTAGEYEQSEKMVLLK